MGKELRKTAIDVVGDVPWGTHFCLFYETKEDLIDTLVPYFKEGLESNEFCMWITSEPLGVEDAKKALKKEVKTLDDYIRKGQIEILDYSQWYTESGCFDSKRVLQGWAEKERQALKKGFEGFRLTGNTFWLGKSDWGDFADYEKVADKVIGKYRMLAICAYSLDRCGASEIVDVVSCHRSALIKRGKKWEIIESSENKKAEEAYRRLAYIVESSDDAIIGETLDGTIVNWNKGAEKMYGYFRDEVVGKHISILVPPGFPDEIPKILEKIKRGEHIRHYETVRVRKDGRQIDVSVSVSPIKDADGNVTGASIIARDITERKRLEAELLRHRDRLEEIVHERTKELEETNKQLREKFAALEQAEKTLRQSKEAIRESEERFRRLSNASFEGIFIHDKHKILDVNSSFAKMFGYEPDELVGADGLSLLTEEYRETADEHTRSADETPWEAECIRKSGSHIFVEAQGREMQFGGRRVRVVAVRDITKEKELERELGRYRDRILRIQKYAYINSMGAMVAHELNQPLTVINMRLGELVAALGKKSDNVRVLKYLKESLLEAENASGIISKFRRCSQSQSWLANKKVNVIKVAKKVVSVLAKRAGQEKLRINIEAARKLPSIKGNEAAIEQIFFNLIQNAIDAAGGEKWHKLDISAEAVDGKIKLKFSDNCRGIATENLEKIFEPFFTTKANGRGMGLGLEIVQRILMSCGGKIDVKSKVGKGTVFHVVLPAGSNIAE